MPVFTPKYGWPTPLGADRVMDGDNAMGTLAAAIESTVGVHGDALSALIPTLQRSSSILNLTTADQLVPGCSNAINATANELGLVFAVFDMRVVTAGVGVLLGSIYLDGTARPGSATFAPATTGQETVTYFTTVGLGTGAHTIELRARKTINAGAASIESAGNSTNLVVLRFRSPITLLRGDTLEELLEEPAG